MVNIIVGMISTPFYGNERLDKKLVYLKDNALKYNTLFIGSSRVNNQVNPVTFDEVSSTKSFNLGIGGCNGLESIKIVEYLLDNSSNYNLSDLIVEFPNSQLTRSDNANSVRGNYFADWNSIKYSLYASAKGKSLLTPILKHSMYYKYLIAKALGLGYFGSKLKSMSTEAYVAKSNMVEGHFPLEGKATSTKSKLKGNRAVDKEYLDHLKKKTVKVFQKKSIQNSNKKWTERLLYIEQLAKSKEINITYVLYPKVEANYYHNALGILMENRELNYIDLARPGDNPKFYAYSYSYDKAHLNSEGADILTKKMGKIFKRQR